MELAQLPGRDQKYRCRVNMAHIKQSRPDAGLDFQANVLDRLRVGCLNGRGTARAKDAQGIPTQSQMSFSILVYEDMTI